MFTTRDSFVRKMGRNVICTNTELVSASTIPTEFMVCKFDSGVPTRHKQTFGVGVGSLLCHISHLVVRTNCLLLRYYFHHGSGISKERFVVCGSKLPLLLRTFLYPTCTICTYETHILREVSILVCWYRGK